MESQRESMSLHPRPAASWAHSPAQRSMKASVPIGVPAKMAPFAFAHQQAWQGLAANHEQNQGRNMVMLVAAIVHAGAQMLRDSESGPERHAWKWPRARARHRSNPRTRPCWHALTSMLLLRERCVHLAERCSVYRSCLPRPHVRARAPCCAAAERSGVFAESQECSSRLDAPCGDAGGELCKRHAARADAIASSAAAASFAPVCTHAMARVDRLRSDCKRAYAAVEAVLMFTRQLRVHAFEAVQRTRLSSLKALQS